MKSKKLLLFFFFLSTLSFGQIPYGNFKIKIGNECSIEFGRIQTSKPVNNKIRFRIDINNKVGYEGAIDGYASIISKNKAIFKSSDCGSILFTFLPGNIIRIKETNCSIYHGANICFNGDYQKY